MKYAVTGKQRGRRGYDMTITLEATSTAEAKAKALDFWRKSGFQPVPNLKVEEKP